MGLGLLIIFLGVSGLVIAGVSYFYLKKRGNNVGNQINNVGVGAQVNASVNAPVNVPISTRVIYCPRCNYNLSSNSFPRSFKEKIFGGWTCPNCLCKVDKLGNFKV